MIPNEAYILKSDYIRVLILYSEGGFYFDCDVRPLNPLKPLTHSDINCVLFSEGINCISNAGMGFTEGHQILKTTLDRIRRNIKELFAGNSIIKNGTVLGKTGPAQIRDASIQHNVDICMFGAESAVGYRPDRIVDWIQENGSLVCPPNALCCHTSGNENLFAFHTCGATWRGQEDGVVSLENDAVLADLSVIDPSHITQSLLSGPPIASGQFPLTEPATKLVFTSCCDEGFTYGAMGLIKSIRKFYTSDEADIVIFSAKGSPYLEAFCNHYEVILISSESILDWVGPVIFGGNDIQNATKHFFHPNAESVDSEGFDYPALLNAHLHSLHPLKLKAYCTAYCLCVLTYEKVVHIDADAFLLCRVDEIFDLHGDSDTVIAFSDAAEGMEHISQLYGFEPPEQFNPSDYAFNAGIVFYRNGPGVRKLMRQFMYFIDSPLHFECSGPYKDQSVLRSLVATHHQQGIINYICRDKVNWNPTWNAADNLEYHNGVWVNTANNQIQRIWHGAGGAKLWNGGQGSHVRDAWFWVGGNLDHMNIPGALIRENTEIIASVIHKKIPKYEIRILEIGTHYGRTAVAWVNQLSALGHDVHVDTIDTFEASIDYRDHYATASKTREILNAYPAYSNIRLHKVDVTTDLASIFEHNYYDAIYIDGAHDYSSVSRDIRAVVPLLHKDGILLGDDFDSQSVAKAVGYQLGRSVRTAGSQWWISASHIRLRAPLTGGRFLLYIPVQLATRSLANDDGGMTIFCDAQTKGFSLNNSARSIYELCDGNRNVRNIIEILSEAYEIQESIIEQQVIESLQQLRACHMVDYA